MRISDEERRRVAQNLRNSRYLLKPVPSGKQIMSMTRAASELELAHEGNYLNQSGFERLADLIDRQTCWNTYDESEMGSCTNGFRCSECGNMVEDYEGYRVSGEFNYCSKCGAIVVGRKPTGIGALKNEDL